MRIITLHTDYIKFKPLKKALKKISELSEKEKKGENIKDALTVLIAVENTDTNTKEVTKKLIENIKDIAKQVSAKKIVLYPYAHLSSNLASPELAIEVLEKVELELKKSFNVTKAPFGYYKEFELKVKGHPLSELSREIKVEGKKEEKIDNKNLLREISKSRLDTSKLKENDHRILGQQMDLYSFNETAPGMVFWHNNGLIIRNKLIDFWREIHRNSGYQEISTPQILDKKLWQISGHWEKYKENIFLTEYEKRQFAVKPMNCPGGILVYKNKPKSYKDLPLRVGELGVVHRQELSGVLGGLFRVIQFTQDDAHIFCTEKQVEDEIDKIIDIINFTYKKLGLNFDHVELSTRPKERIGSDKIWDKAEKALKNILRKKKIKYEINKGDGVFYGPKIDFHIKDSLGRTWQVSTVQLDFLMPERFNLEYIDKDNKRKRPIMLHRVVYGSLERFIGILVEHYKGRFPTWLAPIQVKVISMNDRNANYSRKIKEKLETSGIRVELDNSSESMSKKVRDSQLEKVNYMITVGDKEEKSKTIAIRDRKGKIEFKVKPDKFIERLKKEIDSKL
jgi:threonyl-tRNA synthetase|tara:strand:+ start:2892 stop:4586 length:1695 start_codon:yes stop_codon:yes gene_type:complete